jgi:transcriptional regulator with XRE-family HTH domain
VARPALTGDERRFAEELRRWRERRGLTKKALAAAMAYDPSRVSHVEAGRQPPTEEFARQAETVLQTGGELWACWEAIAASRFGSFNSRWPAACLHPNVQGVVWQGAYPF